jgi:hypothetical protein
VGIGLFTVLPESFVFFTTDIQHEELTASRSHRVKENPGFFYRGTKLAIRENQFSVVSLKFSGAPV